MSDTTSSSGRRGPRHGVTRRPRIRGEERERLRAKLADGYAGASIRTLADRYGLSFGLTRTLLLEADVELRDRAPSHRPAAQ
jgi:hypothetical protein